MTRTALITGAASGIGAATARRLAEEGLSGLVLTDVDRAALKAAAGDLVRDGLDVLTLAFDVGDPAAWADAEGTIRARFGGLDALVANAGVGAGGRLVDLAYEEWRRVLRVNLDGVFLTLKHGLRLMRDGGAAVVVASAAGIKAEPGIGPYAASKAGAAQLAKVAAKEQASRGVRVNAIAPGGVDTPIWNEVPFFRDLEAKLGREAAVAEMAAMATPLKRYASADEIAAQIAWLLSDAAAYMTGAVLVADGGYTL